MPRRPSGQCSACKTSGYQPRGAGVAEFYGSVTETVVAVPGLTPQINPMKPTFRSRFLACLLVLAPVLWTSGCLAVAAGAAGAGAVAWVRGELDATVSHRFDRVDAAANRAIQQLELVKVKESRSAIDAEIIARTGQDKRIVVKLDRVGDQLTRVRIRVGLIGDESLSRLILDKINSNL